MGHRLFPILFKVSFQRRSHCLLFFACLLVFVFWFCFVLFHFVLTEEFKQTKHSLENILSFKMQISVAAECFSNYIKTSKMVVVRVVSLRVPSGRRCHQGEMHKSACLYSDMCYLPLC